MEKEKEEIERAKHHFIYLGYEYYGSQKKHKYHQIKEDEIEKHIENNHAYEYRFETSIYAKPFPSNVKIGFIVQVEGTEFASTIYLNTAKLVGKKINDIAILDLKTIQQGIDSERLIQAKVKDEGSIFTSLDTFKTAYKRANTRNQQILLLKLFDYLNA